MDGLSATTADTTAETALVRRLKAGDDAAFDELVAAQIGRMLSAATRLLRQANDAQDAVQEAFLSAFKASARGFIASRSTRV
jgi:RNA polymerase sigma-70 factor, ECF subfamily